MIRRWIGRRVPSWLNLLTRDRLESDISSFGHHAALLISTTPRTWEPRIMAQPAISGRASVCDTYSTCTSIHLLSGPVSDRKCRMHLLQLNSTHQGLQLHHLYISLPHYYLRPPLWRQILLSWIDSYLFCPHCLRNTSITSNALS